METLRTVLLVIFIVDALLLVIAVLIQSGRGGGLAGALGGIGGADSALGVRAASQIEKATGVMAAIFLIIALTLGLIGIREEPDAGKMDVDDRGVIGSTDGTTPPKGALTPPKGVTTTAATGAAETSPAAKTGSGD